MDPHDKAIIHGSNESDYRTPVLAFVKLDDEFHFDWDLAANKENALCSSWLGPGGFQKNALLTDWAQLPTTPGRAKFLNPPFSKTLVNAYNTGRTKVDGKWVEHEIDREKAKTYDIAEWARKCWEESLKGATIVGVFPFAPQTDWYREYVYGHVEELDAGGEETFIGWSTHAAREERRLPHRISFLQPDGTPTGNAGVNSVVIVWKPSAGIIGPWQPHQFYWSYR